MIVIADTTPLNHLILIEQDRLLRALYGRVVIPRAVVLELQAPPHRQMSMRGSTTLLIGWR
jgi:predicted nucleic acid-binding protein